MQWHMRLLLECEAEAVVITCVIVEHDETIQQPDAEYSLREKACDIPRCYYRPCGKSRQMRR
jgi:hypothetical protein